VVYIMYSVTDARNEATNSKFNKRIQRYSYTHTVNRNSKFNDNTTWATGIKFTSHCGYIKF